MSLNLKVGLIAQDLLSNDGKLFYASPVLYTENKNDNINYRLDGRFSITSLLSLYGDSYDRYNYDLFLALTDTFKADCTFPGIDEEHKKFATYVSSDPCRTEEGPNLKYIEEPFIKSLDTFFLKDIQDYLIKTNDHCIDIRRKYSCSFSFDSIYTIKTDRCEDYMSDPIRKMIRYCNPDVYFKRVQFESAKNNINPSILYISNHINSSDMQDIMYINAAIQEDDILLIKRPSIDFEPEDKIIRFDVTAPLSVTQHYYPYNKYYSDLGKSIRKAILSGRYRAIELFPDCDEKNLLISQLRCELPVANIIRHFTKKELEDAKKWSDKKVVEHNAKRFEFDCTVLRNNSEKINMYNKAYITNDTFKMPTVIYDAKSKKILIKGDDGKVQSSISYDEIISKSYKEEFINTGIVSSIISFIFTIKDVIFSGNKVIVFWTDNTKTIVAMQDDETKYDPEKAILAAYTKKILTMMPGNSKNRSMDKMLDKWLNKYKEYEKEIKSQLKKIKERKDNKKAEKPEDEELIITGDEYRGIEYKYIKPKGTKNKK